MLCMWQNWTDLWLKLPGLYYKVCTDPAYLTQTEEDQRLRKQILLALPSAGVSQLYYFAQEKGRQRGLPKVVYPEGHHDVVILGAALAGPAWFSLVQPTLLASHEQIEAAAPKVAALLLNPSLRSYIEQMRCGFVTPNLAAPGALLKWLERSGVHVLEPEKVLRNGASCCVELLHSRLRERGKEVADPSEIILKNRTYLGALMTEMPASDDSVHADLCVSGADTTTADVLRAVIACCTEPGERLAGYGTVFLTIPTEGGKSVITFVDPAVIQEPTVEERVALGVTASLVSKELGLQEPRGGFVSSSTNGSGESRNTPKFIREQAEAARLASPIIASHGGICAPHESQIDALTVPGVKATDVDGKADWLAYDRLDGANGGMKTFERTGVLAGPMIVSLPREGVPTEVNRMRVSDMSRSAKVVNVMTTTGYLANHWDPTLAT